MTTVTKGLCRHPMVQEVCFYSASGTQKGFGMPLKRGLPCGIWVPRARCGWKYDAGRTGRWTEDSAVCSRIIYVLSSDLKPGSTFKRLAVEEGKDYGA